MTEKGGQNFSCVFHNGFKFDMTFLNKRLYKPHKQEDLKSCNKLIYSLRLDGEKVSNKCRVYSKILKLDENNQYDFTVMKPLPIGTFKNEAHDSTDILFNSKENFDPNAKVGEIFVVDVEFNAYNDTRKKIYNEVLPCIFEPRSNVPVDTRSVYLLLSTMRTAKKNNVLNEQG